MYQLPSTEMEPIFFKYIVPMGCRERLLVPPAHHWNKDREFPDNVILSDKKGKQWPVKLEKLDNYVFFVDGWLDFVKDNNVQVGDFVVFENVGTNVYSVILLDPNTTCEKEDLKSMEMQTTREFEHVKDEEEEEEDDDVEEEEYDNDDDSDLEEEYNSSRRNGHGDHIMTQKKKKRKSTHAWGWGASNRATDIYGNAIFKSRGIPMPTNPYFVTYRRPNRNDELFVPLNVIKDYNLNLPKKTIMRDSRGAEWVTELNVWKDGRCWYYGGWSSFCRKNHVDYSEVCICEFVEEDGNGLILFVYKL